MFVWAKNKLKQRSNKLETGNFNLIIDFIRQKFDALPRTVSSINPAIDSTLWAIKNTTREHSSYALKQKPGLATEDKILHRLTLNCRWNTGWCFRSIQKPSIKFDLSAFFPSMYWRRRLYISVALSLIFFFLLFFGGYCEQIIDDLPVNHSRCNVSLFYTISVFFLLSFFIGFVRCGCL